MRPRASFTADVLAHVRWLVGHRSVDQVDRLRAGLALLRRRLAANPAIGELREQRGTVSLRATRIGGRLPYLVWYYFDETDETAAVWLLMLQHERQERARIGASLIDK